MPTQSSWLLQTDKGPYLLTVLVALTAWALTHSVDRMLASPLVEYTSTIEANAEGKFVSYTVHNISADHVFKDLQFSILTPEGEIKKGRVTVHAPMTFGERRVPPVETTTSYSVTFPYLHPGWTFDLAAQISGDAKPRLVFTAAEPVRLVQASIETTLTKYERALLASVILLGTVLIAVYLYLLVRSAPHKEVLNV